MDVSETGSDSMSDTSLPQTYQLKTMCLAKKTAQMPTKEEHGFLLFCGLGARKWEVDMNCNSLTFKQAILNIYPRLRSVIGYNLYTVSKDKKQFERIPEKVNTPKRIRSFLGPLFTGCLIIVPVSDIVLMEEKREHLRQIDVRQTQAPVRPAPVPDTRHRSLCLICGKSEKTPGTGSFYRIMEETIECYGGRGETIVKKLTDILGFNFEAKRKFLASVEICKKCLRTTTEVVRMEEQVKKNKEELVSNFFTTTSKYKNKTQGSQSEADCKLAEPAPAPAPTMANGHGPFPGYSGAGNGFPPAQGYPPMMANSGNFLVQPMAFMNQHKHLQYGNGIVQFYQPQPYPTIRHTNGRDKKHDDIGEKTNGEANGSVASEATPSELGSSSYISMSPPRPKRDMDEDSNRSSVCSPRPFDDTQSYLSSFSFKSCSSYKSKAEIKSYDEPMSLEIDKEDRDKLEAECDKRKRESNDTSPRSLTSPVSTSSPKPESLESNSTSTSPGPDNDKEQREMDMRKPWKKRKLVQESGGSNSGSGGDTPGKSTPEPAHCQTEEDKTEDKGGSDS